MGCSFNPELVEEMARAIATESLALGVNQLFAPLADLARELRYGRVEECFSEDSYLYASPSLISHVGDALTLVDRTGEMAYSFAKGLQEQGVSATIKHFVCQSSVN